ncbi:MAG TPA: EAL domain-containing protein [Bacilli bacterium]
MRDLAKNLLFPFRSWKNLLFLLCLAGLGCLGNLFVLPFSFGIELFFGSIFHLVVAVLFGPVWGAAAAVLAAIVSPAFYAIPGYAAAAAAEAFFIGIVCFRDRRRVVLWALLYWLVVGVPFLALIYYWHHRHVALIGYVFFMHVLVNGLFNALAADIMLTYMPWRKVLLGKTAANTRLVRILVHLTVLAVIGPFFLTMLFNYNYNEKTIFHNAHAMLAAKTDNIAEEINDWPMAEKEGLRFRNVIQLGSLKELLLRNATDDTNMIVADDGGHEIMSVDAKPLKESQNIWAKSGTFKRLDDHFYLWLPGSREFPYSMDRWREGLLVNIGEMKNYNINVVALVPVATYLADITISLYHYYVTVLLCIFLAGLLAYLVNATLVKSLSNLAQTTTGLPFKLAGNAMLEWPRSQILEISALIVNFRLMAENLVQMFNHTKQMTEKLKIKTAQLQISEERLHFLAYYDALTGLPNRLLFTKNLNKALKEARESDTSVAVLFLDLDQFKKINDTMGHAAGDRLLQIMASKLQPLSQTNVQVFRLGGDEFVALMKNATVDAAHNFANEVLARFARSIFLYGQEIFVTASVGISMFPEDGGDSDTIVKNADTAMYAAKEKGGNNIRFFDASMNRIISDRMTLETSLRKALELEQFELYYQPKYDSLTDEIVGAEALLRWNHPEKGFISPAVFVPLAEETGLINQIGEWVIRTVCRQNKTWHDIGFHNLCVAVNISARQLYEPDFVGKISRILKETRLKAKYLQLEITEGFFIHDMNYVVDVINKLHKMGIRLSIDDFGTGYSSLNQLKHLPIYELKIDQSFIRNISTERHNAAIVKAVIEMAHSMGLIVVAEGLETLAEKEYLIGLRCDQLQGFLMSKPLSAEGFAKLLKRHFEYAYGQFPRDHKKMR